MISVVIPLYNKAPHIERTLHSVVQQNIDDYEVIVVDDGSTDGGGNLVDGFKDTRIKLIRQENQGKCLARNTGIAAARADLVAFLDADDTWEPQFLETILHLRKKFPQAGAYATAYQILTRDGSTIRPEFNVLPVYLKEGLIENYFRAAISYPICSSAVAILKKVLVEIGGFPVGEFKGEDLDTWLRIALRYPIAWSKEYLASWYQNAVNRSDRFLWQSEPAVSRTARQALDSDLLPADQAEALREFAADNQLGAARECLISRKKEVALQMLHYARGTKAFTGKWWKYRLLAAIPGHPTPWLWELWTIKQALKSRLESYNKRPEKL
jgi:glycosyltransferase involved in cell wall biosynthesis